MLSNAGYAVSESTHLLLQACTSILLLPPLLLLLLLLVLVDDLLQQLLHGWHIIWVEAPYLNQLARTSCRSWGARRTGPAQTLAAGCVHSRCSSKAQQRSGATPQQLLHCMTATHYSSCNCILRQW